MANYGVILVTADTQVSAQEMARALVSDRLVACVNLYPIHSVYTWEGKLEEAAEWQLVIKTDLALFNQIESVLQTLHPYDVPEILALPIQQGSQPYLAWMADVTRSIQ
ncbi:MAG: divalent-cation tolerance protein CutA [Cyanobacteria bacterium P01_H01_bin.153]